MKYFCVECRLSVQQDHVQNHLLMCPDKMIVWDDRWITKVVKEETNGSSEIVEAEESSSSSEEESDGV